MGCGCCKGGRGACPALQASRAVGAGPSSRWASEGSRGEAHAVARTSKNDAPSPQAAAHTPFWPQPSTCPLSRPPPPPFGASQDGRSTAHGGAMRAGLLPGGGVAPLAEDEVRAFQNAEPKGLGPSAYSLCTREAAAAAAGPAACSIGGPPPTAARAHALEQQNLMWRSGLPGPSSSERRGREQPLAGRSSAARAAHAAPARRSLCWMIPPTSAASAPSLSAAPGGRQTSRS